MCQYFFSFLDKKPNRRRITENANSNTKMIIAITAERYISGTSFLEPSSAMAKQLNGICCLVGPIGEGFRNNLGMGIFFDDKWTDKWSYPFRRIRNSKPKTKETPTKATIAQNFPRVPTKSAVIPKTAEKM